MNSQSVVDSSRPKEFIALAYHHPELDPVIDRLFPDPPDNQSVRHILDVIAWKQRLKLLEYHRAKEKGTDKGQDNPYCWFNHEFYLRMLGPERYFGQMALLVENRVLNSSSFTSPVGRHPIYQLTSEDHLKGYTLTPITIPRVIKKIENYRQWRIKHYAPLDNKMREHIAKNFCTIDLTESTFRALWEKRYHSRYKSNKPHPLPWDEYNKCGDLCWLIISRWNQSSIAERMAPLLIKACPFGNRLHHPFTYLPSDIRAYILDQHGNPIRFTEFDLANSQPALFANMMIAKNPSIRNTVLVRLIEECRIYEDLASKMSTTRQIAKTEFLHFLYCMATTKAQDQFEAYYGWPAREARKLKSRKTDDDGTCIPFDKRHKLLPREMQRMESGIFRKIWQELLTRGFVFLPVHDAVYVANLNRKAKKEVLAVVKMILNQYMTIKYKVKMELIRRYE